MTNKKDPEQTALKEIIMFAQGLRFIIVQFKVNGYTSVFPQIFKNENNFCDFLFTSKGLKEPFKNDIS